MYTIQELSLHIPWTPGTKFPITEKKAESKTAAVSNGENLPEFDLCFFQDLILFTSLDLVYSLCLSQSKQNFCLLQIKVSIQKIASTVCWGGILLHIGCFIHSSTGCWVNTIVPSFLIPSVSIRIQRPLQVIFQWHDRHNPCMILSICLLKVSLTHTHSKLKTCLKFTIQNSITYFHTQATKGEKQKGEAYLKWVAFSSRGTATMN